MDSVIGVSRYDEGMGALSFQVRRFFKWVTLGACFLITGLWVAGWRWSFGYSTTRWSVAAGGGVVGITIGRAGTLYQYPLNRLNIVVFPREGRGMSWRPYYTSFAPSPGFGMFIPLWMVFLPVALLNGDALAPGPSIPARPLPRLRLQPGGQRDGNMSRMRPTVRTPKSLCGS